MDEQGLRADAIRHPEMCRMVLRVLDGRLDAAVYSTVEDNSLVYRSIALDASAPTPLKALEEALYANPLLVQDNFDRTTVLVDTPRMVLVPKGEAQAAEEALERLYPELDADVVTTQVRGGAALGMAVEQDLTGFLRRTFATAQITHRLVPLCNYFGVRGRMGTADRMHVHLHEGHTDIVAYSGDELLMANTFVTPEAMDTVYYTLAAAKQLGYDNSTDRMLLSGDAGPREEVLPTLRRYISHAMPAIFPSALFRLGKDAMTVPLEMLETQIAEI